MREQAGRLPDRSGHRRRLLPDGPRRGDARAAGRIGCRSSWAPTPKRAACSPASCKMLPTNESMIEELLADAEPAARERITAAYPDYPSSSACIQLGGDFAFSSAAWQIAEAHGSARAHLPVPVRLRPADAALVGSGSHPRHRVAGRLRRLPHPVRRAADRRGRSARRAAGQQPSATAVAGLQPHRRARATTGPPTPPPTAPSWSSTARVASSSIRIRSAGWHGTASHWRDDLAR